MYLAKDFDKFPDEASIVGRILVSYSNLEIDLMNCVKEAIGELDTALKVLFRSRGETLRINLADALARQQFVDIGLESEFKSSIDAITYCKEIRNQYAHSNWWDDNSGKLAFASLEEISKSNDLITDLSSLTTKHVDIKLLTDQFDYFEYTSELFNWLLNRHNELKGKTFYPDMSKPKHSNSPRKYI